MFKYQVDKSQDNGGHYFVNRDGDFISKSYEFYGKAQSDQTKRTRGFLLC